MDEPKPKANEPRRPPRPPLRRETLTKEDGRSLTLYTYDE